MIAAIQTHGELLHWHPHMPRPPEPISREVWHKLLDMCDGTTILCPHKLKLTGVPESLVNRLTNQHDIVGKGFWQTGVHDRELLGEIARGFGLYAPPIYRGTGFMALQFLSEDARQIKEAIEAEFSEATP